MSTDDILAFADLVAAVERLQQRQAELEATVEEVKQLRSDLNTLACRYASSGDLLELYAERQAKDPSLSLRRFLGQIGAPGRYRALISARERQRRKRAMQPSAAAQEGRP